MVARRWIIACLVSLSAAASVSFTTASTLVTPATPAILQDQTVSFNPFRLRKLHLVRPDLIPYPLAYEVIC